MTPLRVDVVSDVVCPWCFVGKRRLEAAARLLPDILLDVHWRPFQLDHTIPPGGTPREAYLLNKFKDPERIAQMLQRLTTVGEGEGIPFAFDKIKVSPNTLDAHRLLRWAEPKGLQNILKERLMMLYFVEGGNLADLDALAEAAAQSGLDRAEMRRKLDTEDDIEAVRSDIAAAHRLGVTGVPFFIFGNALALPGAHEVPVMIDAIQQATARVRAA